MKLQLAAGDPNHAIRRCARENHAFSLVIGETTYVQSLILTPEAVELWPVAEVAQLTRNEFERLASLPVKVLLLGTGSRLCFPDPAITQPLMARGLGLEVMDTAAACRTYNVLLADGRQPGAALIA